MKLNDNLKKILFGRTVAIALAAGILLTAAVSCGLTDGKTDESDTASGAFSLDSASMQSLSDFLKTFVSRYPVSPDGKWEYDSSDAAGGSNILACIATPASCADWALYSDIPSEDCFVEKNDDPRGWSNETYAYYVYDGETVDFIARDIFNVSESDIRILREAGEKNRLFYHENGRYYTLYEGVFDSYSDIEIISVAPLNAAAVSDGDINRYVVKFNVNGVINKSIDNEMTLIRGERSAELELKNIGGREYWSLYRFY